MRTEFVGFGLERLGLIPARAPKICLTAVILIAFLGGMGIWRLKQGHSMADFFRSDGPPFSDYQSFNRRFPASEFDLLLMLEAPDLLLRDNLETIRTVHLDLTLVEGVSQVISIFSLPDAPDENGEIRPLFPTELPDGEALDKIIERVANDPLFRGKLFSLHEGETQTALIIVALDPGAVREAGFMLPVQDINSTVQKLVAPTGLRYFLTGVPLMRSEIRKAGRHDLIIYNSGGFAIGLSLCILFFRNFSAALRSRLLVKNASRTSPSWSTARQR